MSHREALTVEEISAIVEEMFLKEEKGQMIATEDVDVAILPPPPDELTDEEDIAEEDILDCKIHDVAGTLELYVPESNEVDDQNENNGNRKRKRAHEQSVPATSKNEHVTNAVLGLESKWKKCDPLYTKTKSSSKNHFEKLEVLSNKTVMNIFEEFISDELISHIVAQSKLYATQKNCPNFDVTGNEMKVFIGILFLSGYHSLPQQDMYWEQAPDVGVPFVYNAMTRQRFKDIKRFLHLNDNSKIDKTDKMYKLRPFFDILQKNFMKFGVFSAHLSLDEMMVKYYGMHPAKMYMRGKPIKFGYKIWCLCSSNGYLYNFSPYVGKSEVEQGPLGQRVISKLTSVLHKDDIEDYEIFFDNFFTSVPTLIMLKDRKLKASGTVRENRTNKCPLMNSKVMEKNTERGHIDYRYDTNNEILVVKWNDSKAVSVATNYSTVTPTGKAKRFSSKEKKQVSIPVPNVISEYNSYMGGVDLLDKQISLYRTKIRSKKWWWVLFTQFLDVAVVNTWRLQQILHPEDRDSLLDVKRKIVLGLVSKPTNTSRKRPGPQRSALLGGRVPVDIRFDSGNHLVQPIATQRRCAACGKKTKRICGRCDVPLHDICFAPFHTK